MLVPGDFSLFAVIGGFGDVSIAGAVIGCIAASAVGVIYGAFNWNRGDSKRK